MYQKHLKWTKKCEERSKEWDKVNYKLAFTASMYDVLRKIDTNVTSLYLVYEMWDSVIDKVRKVIYRQERKAGIEELKFYNVRP